MSDKKPENDDAIDSLWNQAVADANKSIPGAEAPAIALPGSAPQSTQGAIALPGAAQPDNAIALPGPTPPVHTIDIEPGDPLSVEEMAPPPMAEVEAVIEEAKKANDPRLASPLSDPSITPGSEDAPIALPPPTHIVKDESPVELSPPATAPLSAEPAVAAPQAAVAPSEPKEFKPLPSATEMIEKERSIPWLGILFAVAAVGGLLFLLLGNSKDPEPEPSRTAKVIKKIETKTVVEPKATEPKATEPKATEPKATEPKATEPKATEPKATEPKATEPKATEPKATEPKATEPKATEPKATEPKATEPTSPKSSGGTQSALIMQLRDAPKVLVSRAYNFAGPDADELSSPFRAAIIRALRADGRGFESKKFGAYLKPYLTKLTIGDKDTARCVLRVALSKQKGAEYFRLSATGQASSDDTHQKAVSDCAKNLIAEFSKNFPR